MGNVIAFPGNNHQEHYEPELDPALPSLLQEAAHFSQLTHQQQEFESRSAFFEPSSPAQLRMDRVAAGALDARIDESVRRLQQAPASQSEASSNLQMLFGFAEDHPHDVDNLEVATLYAMSAYWDGEYVDTAFVAPLLRARASAAFLRSSGNSLPPVVDAIRAVVTSHIASCMDNRRLDRWKQLYQFGLIDFYDVSDSPDDHPPAA
jgi:hypothetical protein